MAELRHRYHPRSTYLPDPAQTYLAVAGVRPNHGPCPDCAAPEGDYCWPSCGIVDPLAHMRAEKIGRCLICIVMDHTHNSLRERVILNGRWNLRHLIRPNGEMSLCGKVKITHGHIVNGVRW